ncbi:MAG: chloride channel protein [Candidatus Omnitrophica bacterium]|nr:chloride channel protein [Candidatus Omnitrophota bacterium]
MALDSKFSKILSSLSRWIFLFKDEHFLLILLGIPIGICGGLAAVALNHSIEICSEALHVFHGHWTFVFFPAIGAVLSIFVLSVIFHEGSGHAVPIVIYSVLRKGGLLRFRSSVSHLLGCLCTISFGGSAGPEAPVVVSGSSIGSTIARLFSLHERQRVAMAGCGIAAAISAIFNAPIAGIVFTIEIILCEWSTVNLAPIALASVTATQTSRILRGNQIPFEHFPFEFTTLDVIACLGLAVMVSVIAVLFSKVLAFAEHTSSKLASNIFVRGIAGGICVGLIGLFAPDVLGEGYHTIRAIIEQRYAPTFLILLLLIVGKIAATSLTLGTGSAGGVFAPALVLGSMTGLCYWQMLDSLWPSREWVGGGCFALLGMAGMISGVLHAPLTGIFLIVEITGGYEVVVPLILVSVLAATISRAFLPASIYYRELMDRGQLLRPRTDARILADIDIQDVIQVNLTSIPPDTPLRDFSNIIQRTGESFFPVIDPQNGKFHGLVFVERAQPYLLSQELYDAILVEEIIEGSNAHVSLNDDLLSVMDRFEHERTDVLPVIEQGRFLGAIAKSDILDQYRKELIVQTTT